MLAQEAVNALTQMLWTTPEDRVYALLDGAGVTSLLDRLYADPRPEFECLLYGELKPDMAEVAPYLVALERDAEFADWVITQGWGNHWGCFAVTRVDLRALWFHLRQLSIVHGPDGKPMLFRYYDPRVLRIFLPTCSPDQVKELFGPVDRFVTEADVRETALTFTHANGVLQTGTRRIVRA
jgi:hypothetical protein